MLLKVLDEIKESREHSISELARKLSITESFLHHLLDELIKRGFLTKYDQNCQNLQCGNCAIIKSCKDTDSKAGKTIYILTEKGMNSYVARNFISPSH